MRAKAVGSSVVVLEWTSGFNGGFAQTFTVESKLNTQSDGDYEKIRDSIVDPAGGNLVLCEIAGLQSQTGYTFRVQAISSRTSDNSKPYATLTITTLGEY